MFIESKYLLEIKRSEGSNVSSSKAEYVAKSEGVIFKNCDSVSAIANDSE
jgi:hypothetical protein